MKITCDVIQDLMPSYIDGILSEDSRALVEEHMGTCQECRKMLENSGMYVKNNSLYSSNNLINRMKVQYTEDGKTEFVYAIDAPYAGTLELKGDDMLLQDFSKKTEEVSPEDDSTPETVTEVYYMSAEARKKSLKLTELEAKGDLDAAEKIVDEMKQESKLIWSEQEDRNTASSMLK